jgi:RNA polymerase sigma-70 factor (ECF subfamily)
MPDLDLAESSVRTPPLERLEPESLGLRVQRGEPRAIGELYDLHHQVVRAFARRLVGEPAAAEDLVHEVFVALPSAMSRYRGEGSLRTFLISMVINRARHHVRSASRRRAALQRLSLEPAAGAHDPERIVQGSQLAALLTRALDQVPLDQRVAFVLCEVEEKSSREAAAIAGIPEATVRTRLHHAKRKLRDLLSREGVRS